MCNLTKSSAAKELFSEKRLSKYNDLNDYLDNIKISQKYYPELHFIEISLRNKIDKVLLKKLGSNWITKNRQYIPKEQLLKIGTKHSHDDILSNLTFGTWVYLLSNCYKLFGDHDLGYIFGVSKKQINQQFKKLCNELKIIKNFRNRIFHYEKINNHSQYKNIGHLINKFIKLLDIEDVLKESLHTVKNQS